MSRPLDDLDLDILTALTTEPRISILELARRLSIARGTAQARVDRLHKDGVIAEDGTVDTAKMGYPVTAFLTLEISQHGQEADITEHLAGIPEVLEAHTITGPSDMMLRLVAKDNDDLQRIIDTVNSHPAAQRSSTLIALATRIRSRIRPLLSAPPTPSPQPAQLAPPKKWHA